MIMKPGFGRGLVLAAVGVVVTGSLVAAPVAAASADQAVSNGCRPSVRALPGLGGSFAEAVAFNRQHVFVGAATTAEGSYRATFWARGRVRVIATGLEDDSALDINDRGTIVGSGRRAGTEVSVSWLYRDGTLHLIRGLGGSTNVDSINTAGTMIGGADSDGVLLPVRWAHWWSRPEPLPLLPGDEWGFASGLSDDGSAAGASVSPTGVFHPVRWDPRGAVQALPTRPGLDWGYATAVNDRGDVAGSMSNAVVDSPQNAVMWSRGRLHDLGRLPGDVAAYAEGIADNGWVVGRSDLYSDQGLVSRHGFFWSGRGRILALPALASDWRSSQSRPQAVDAAGTVAGFSSDDAGVLRATIWTCAQRLAFRPPAAAQEVGPTPRVSDPDSPTRPPWATGNALRPR